MRVEYSHCCAFRRSACTPQSRGRHLCTVSCQKCGDHRRWDNRMRKNSDSTSALALHHLRPGWARCAAVTAAVFITAAILPTAFLQLANHRICSPGEAKTTCSSAPVATVVLPSRVRVHCCRLCMLHFLHDTARWDVTRRCGLALTDFRAKQPGQEHCLCMAVAAAVSSREQFHRWRISS